VEQCGIEPLSKRNRETVYSPCHQPGRLVPSAVCPIKKAGDTMNRILKSLVANVLIHPGFSLIRLTNVFILRN